MCGIFGYTGNKPAFKIIHLGLKRLEYRGYDSWGISLSTKEGIKTTKQIGEIPEKVKEIGDSTLGIGHTRWATHGGVTKWNAHPHNSLKYNISIAQNGIVENYLLLKDTLEREGYKFTTEVDTEIILHQIEYFLDKGENLKDSIIHTYKLLTGRNTIIVLEQDSKKIYAIKNGSPLILGIGNEELFLASDPLAFNNYTQKVIYLNNNEIIQLSENSYEITDIKSNKVINREPVVEKGLNQDISKDQYDHYMIKEIEQQKDTILSATNYSLKELEPLIELMSKANTIYTIGAGTAGYSADEIAFFLREISNVKAISVKSYEVQSYTNLFNKEDILFAFSQSGETADTIEAIELAKSKGVKIVSIVNMPGSSISRLSDYTFMSNAGPEVCVASTKVFTSQISFGYLLAKSYMGKYKQAKEQLKELSKNLTEYFNSNTYTNIKEIVSKIKGQEHFFVLGKGQNFHIAQEGALKVKEISYKHFEGFSAGELKHGVIALVEKDVPVISIISKDGNENDMLSSTQEVKARGAYTLGIGDIEFSNMECFDDFISVANTLELKAISNVIPFQLLSYFLSVEIGNNIDKPRNLAKSVTVK